MEIRAGARGRVVMLVDNAVQGDSRVQKSARSAAEAGWDVTLLGRSPDGEPHRWHIGDALVRLLPMGRPGAPAPRTPRRNAVALLGRLGLRTPVERAYTRLCLRLYGDRAWRRLQPALWSYEHAYGPVLDELAPDLIHANDFRMLGVGARGLLRARAAGRRAALVWDAHEFLPGIKPWSDNVRWLPAQLAHEREYARHADAVVTVSPELARLLQREHDLPELPAVVLNAPDRRETDQPVRATRTLRSGFGLGAGDPLLVYSGAAAPQRGLDVLVEALPLLPGVHVALVVNHPDGEYVRSLTARAADLGVGGRLHVRGYVPHDEVVPLLAGADLGVIPIQHWPNHEIALITKFFEYSHARLPIVVSDVRTMAGTVRATGQGEVFRAGDAGDLARAVRAVLADPGRYRAAYDDPALLAGWTWERQAGELDRVYARLVPAAVAGGTDAYGRVG
ncbi:glycosyltransferase family 4 protein [Micromonospora echinofusca]|uniref:glycosyltransferase family 4 protein n=1 Tax=Micromonospora echinofusca TaxID=47858 RepID=UPI0020203216|nr:glycosyltransferase family 4 protein [Micromonospora sp. MSM11]MCL7456630.1 glycosyltransferase family 4 protein [Micromonospora sp. MSM11]